MLPAKGSGSRLGSARFNIQTGGAQKLRLNLTPAAAGELARDEKLPVRLVARIRGKVSAKRTTVLRAAK